MFKHFYTIRPFTSSDAEATARMHHAVYHDVSKHYRADELPYFPIEHFTERWGRYRNAFSSLQDVTFVAQNDVSGEIVGLHRFGRRNDPDDNGVPTLNLNQFYVKKELSGLGSAFLYLSLSLSAQNGFTQARIERNTHNIVSKAFQYKRLLAVDVPALSYNELDIPKGKFGAPFDIFSPITVSYIYDIPRTCRHLRESLNTLSLPYRVDPSVSGLLCNTIKPEFFIQRGR